MKKYMILDKYGWPVVGFKNRPVLTFLRQVIHGRKIITREEWNRREQIQMNVACGAGQSQSLYKNSKPTQDK